MGSSGAISIGGATCRKRSAGLRLSAASRVRRAGHIRFMLCSSVAMNSASLARYSGTVLWSQHTRAPFRERYQKRYGVRDWKDFFTNLIALCCVTLCHDKNTRLDARLSTWYTLSNTRRRGALQSSLLRGRPEMRKPQVQVRADRTSVSLRVVQKESGRAPGE
jgi:hypothetical protein